MQIGRTTHRLIVSKMHLKIRPAASRRNRIGTKKINCAALRNDSCRQHYTEEVAAILHDYGSNEPEMSVEESWNQVSHRLMVAAAEILVSERKNHRDWVKECATEIQTHLDEKQSSCSLFEKSLIRSVQAKVR